MIIYHLIPIFLLSFSITVNSLDIEETIRDYFTNESISQFEKVWSIYKKPFEGAIALALKETFANKDVNVVVKREGDRNSLAQSLYTTDGSVDLYLLNINLTELPILVMPSVDLNIPKNYLRLKSDLTPIYMLAEYVLFRNSSSIYVPDVGTDPHTYSPFTLQQVHSTGYLAITGHDCYLEGIALTILSGRTVHFGQDSFRVHTCKFKIEIFNPDRGSPPVIAPYFSVTQSVEMLRLMTKAVRLELLPKIEGAILSYVNTRNLFNKNLASYSTSQRVLINHTLTYMIGVIRTINERGVDSLELPSLNLYWNDTSVEKAALTNIVLHDMNLYGVDTLYSGNAGGPFEMDVMIISETLRFHQLQVRGNLSVTSNTQKLTQRFVVEFTEVPADVLIMLGDKENKDPKLEIRLAVIAFGTVQVTTPLQQLLINDRLMSYELITGYLLHILPDILKQYLEKAIFTAIVHKKAAPNDEGKEKKKKKCHDSTNEDDEEEKEGEDENALNTNTKDEHPPDQLIEDDIDHGSINQLKHEKLNNEIDASQTAVEDETGDAYVELTIEPQVESYTEPGANYNHGDLRSKRLKSGKRRPIKRHRKPNLRDVNNTNIKKSTKEKVNLNTKINGIVRPNLKAKPNAKTKSHIKAKPNFKSKPVLKSKSNLKTTLKANIKNKPAKNVNVKKNIKTLNVTENKSNINGFNKN